MADSRKAIASIFKWEGGWSDNKSDKGGKTNMGITLDTWKSCGYDKDGDHDIDSDDLKVISKEDVYQVFKKYYWDKWKADNIKSQSIAEFVVDWLWNSGIHGIKKPQEVLGLTADGVVGNITLARINDADQKQLFEALKAKRIQFIENIVKNNPSQKVFLNGWMNRINDFKYNG